MRGRSRTSRIARSSSSQLIQRKTPAIMAEELEQPPSINAQLQAAKRGHSLSTVSVGASSPLAQHTAPMSTGHTADQVIQRQTKEAAQDEIASAPENASGTVPDVVTLPGQGRETGQEELSASVPESEGEGNVVADLQVSFSQSATDRDGGKQDSVVSGVTLGPLSQPGGRAVSPFGSEFYEPAFTNVSYDFADSKCTIKATLDVNCPWGTNSGGCTDVPSATDAVVTAANWKDIKKDLTPSSVSPHKSPRTKFYSQALVERHEQFHGTDDFGWTTSSGIGIVKKDLETGTVTPTNAAAEVQALLDKARKKLISENFKWYQGGGSSHDSYAGEIRAYADGRPLYQALADGVEQHGKTLKP